MTAYRIRAVTAAMTLALIAGACSSEDPAASASPSASTVAPSASASGPPASTASSSPEPSAAPTAPPATPAPRTGAWSQPQAVGDIECEQYSAVLDATGYHVVANCVNGLQHLSSESSEDWAADPVPAPEEGSVYGPQVAVDGEWLYVAYTRVESTGDTCTPYPYENLGVEVRSRQLPDGPWAEPMPVGMDGDALQSLRVVDTVIYATVTPADGEGAAFVTRAEGPPVRVEIPDAVNSSLRIGDDGRPRIAYSTGDAIRVGMVHGDELTSALVTEATSTDLLEPALVLAPGDVSSLVWTQTQDAEAGCGGPGEADGTYFATDETGTWAVTRITELTGETSLTVDPTRGEAHALVATGDELHHFVRDRSGSWSSSLLPGGGTDPVIRVDPVTGALVAFALADGEIRVFTQPVGDDSN